MVIWAPPWLSLGAFGPSLMCFLTPFESLGRHLGALGIPGKHLFCGFHYKGGIPMQGIWEGGKPIADLSQPVASLKEAGGYSFMILSGRQMTRSALSAGRFVSILCKGGVRGGNGLGD